MKTFADRLIARVRELGNPCVVGLDPRVDLMPEFVRTGNSSDESTGAVRSTIVQFNRAVIEVVAGLVPAVKLQSAFYEQYGVPGMKALRDSIQEAKRCGLIVIVDAK